MTSTAPIRFMPEIEQIQPDEQKTIGELEQTFDTILTKTAEDYGHAVRSVHAKTHGLLEGTLTVESGLPPELAQGMFRHIRRAQDLYAAVHECRRHSSRCYRITAWLGA